MVIALVVVVQAVGVGILKRGHDLGDVGWSDRRIPIGTTSAASEARDGDDDEGVCPSCYSASALVVHLSAPCAFERARPGQERAARLLLSREAYGVPR